MDDLISRKAAIDALCKRCDLVNDDTCGERCIDIKIIEKLPSVDASCDIPKFRLSEHIKYH